MCWFLAGCSGFGCAVEVRLPQSGQGLTTAHGLVGAFACEVGLLLALSVA